MDSLTEWASSGALLLVKQIAESLGSNSISGVPAPTDRRHFSQAFLHTHLHSPSSCRRASPLFCVDLFENVNLHRLVGHQTLKPRVFLLTSWPR